MFEFYDVPCDSVSYLCNVWHKITHLLIGYEEASYTGQLTDIYIYIYIIDQTLGGDLEVKNSRVRASDWHVREREFECVVLSNHGQVHTTLLPITPHSECVPGYKQCMNSLRALFPWLNASQRSQGHL